MITSDVMRSYLSRSLSSMNRNKVRGLIAEVELRKYIEDLGYGERVSAGGWIARSVKSDTGAEFGDTTVALFPETVLPDREYRPDRDLPQPAPGLHTICSTMHQIGIKSLYCVPIFPDRNNPESVTWKLIQLGIPGHTEYQPLERAMRGFSPRERRYSFLRYNSDVSSIPASSVPGEFTKELLRVSFQTLYMAEVSDIDGILWGQQHTYPLEIKEKTPAQDRKLGEYFGLDIGPFVKLAFYAAKRGNLHSIFVVREIDNEEDRELVEWRYITFEVLAQYASWVFGGGGQNMQGGQSSVVKIPKSRFRVLDRSALENL